MKLLSDLTMVIEASLGADIEDVCQQMCILSHRLGVPIQCEFNHVTLYSGCTGDYKKLKEEYHQELGSSHQFRFASA